MLSMQIPDLGSAFLKAHNVIITNFDGNDGIILLEQGTKQYLSFLLQEDNSTVI